MVVLLGNLPTIFALIVSGIFAGLLAGLLGVGGGISLFRYYISYFKALVFQRKVLC
jgi:uncharacterized membrane protein YfcA